MPGDVLPLFRFAHIPPEIHAISTRLGGVSTGTYTSLNVGMATDDEGERVRDNRSRLLSALNLDPQRVVSARLSHGNAVTALQRRSSADVSDCVASGSVDSDAVVSDVPGLSFLLTFADCVPIVLHDPVASVVGAVHAGWRGTAAGITAAAVRTMVETFGSRPATIRAGIGPSIGPCCFTVRNDVLEAFAESGQRAVVNRIRETMSLDLWESNREQLVEAGVRPAHIQVAEVCTACRTDRFFSHRAERGRTGRFAMVVGVR